MFIVYFLYLVELGNLVQVREDCAKWIGLPYQEGRAGDRDTWQVSSSYSRFYGLWFLFVCLPLCCIYQCSAYARQKFSQARSQDLRNQPSFFVYVTGVLFILTS